MSPTKPTLGRLEKVDLRAYWLREATEFTPWLATAENISLLGDAIGIELEVEAAEKSVGPFSADILCKDTATSDWVLIENQLERTDHTHLGQLLTYAAGLSAVSIVWIAARFTDEHRAALDWLNEHTSERINFFGLEIELWKIGESAIAPKFNVVCKPNDWTKSGATISARALQGGGLSEGKQLQLEYWTAFTAYVSERGATFKTTKPLPQHWLNIAIGRTGFKLNAIASLYDSATASFANNEIRAELYLTDSNSKAYFQMLLERKTDIESAIGHSLTWHNPPDSRSCSIQITRTANIRDRESWNEQHEWLRVKLEALYRVFRPIVMSLDASNVQETDPSL